MDGYFLTVVVTLALLLAVFGSLTVALTEALLLMVPTVIGLMVMVTVAFAPLFSVPIAQLTVAVPLHVPLVETALTKTLLDGNVSVSVTLVALLGPLLRTVKV